jgi:small subunit ribosomal protein S16
MININEVVNNMSVKIRLARGGKKKSPVYQIVAADSRTPRDGKYIAKLGRYDPKTNSLKIDKESINELVKNGAQLSDKVKQLFKNSDNEGNLKIKSKPKKKKKVAKTEEAAA